VNLLGDNIDTIKKNTESLIDDSKEVCLEVNTEKIKYMLLSRHKMQGISSLISRQAILPCRSWQRGL
jgi:hypothetical protein